MTATILIGDCREQMATLADESVDSVVTDPPAGIGFMGKEWDSDKGGRDKWIAWLESVMREALRVLKPGGYAVVWAIPRTSHWPAMAIENAGFEVRDVLTHHFGSGFPKSLDVSRAIDLAAGVDPEYYFSTRAVAADRYPVTPEAKEHEGKGTALKPATEHWILARKPLVGTVAQNVLRYGTGGIDVDGCRVEGGERAKIKGLAGPRPDPSALKQGSVLDGTTTQGRWPPNLLLTHAARCDDAGCVACCPVFLIGEQSGERTSGSLQTHHKRSGEAQIGTFKIRDRTGEPCDFGGDTGTAARFFPTFRYEPKPSTAERERGLGHFDETDPTEITGRKKGSAGQSNPRAGVTGDRGRRNLHPTVKPIALMQWLVRLVTPKGGIVLDMFFGSGTTGIAALREGRSFIGIDDDPHFVEIARARLIGDAPLFNKDLFSGG